MALKIWLPLNGDTNNLGLADFQPAAADIEYAESGKIGSMCYATGSITMSANQTASIFNNDALSIAFWIKPLNATKNGIIFGNNNNRQFSLFQYSGDNAAKHGTSLHWSWHISFDGNSWLTDVLPEAQWTHVCVTYKKPTLKIYINGTLKATHTKRSTSNDATSFAYDTKIINNEESEERYINDLRIYDHCLSVNEVKTLSQGLTAHYKLTNFDYITEHDHSGYNNNLTLIGNIINDLDSPRYLSSINFNNSGYYKKDDFNLTTGQFTCSFWIKPPAITKNQHFLLGTQNTNWAPTNGFCMWRDKNATVYNCALCANNLSFVQSSFNITPGQWQHLVFVYNGTKLIGYKNGDTDNPILNITYGNNNTINHSHFYLGNSTYRQAPVDEIDEVSISDFRFYVTALSITDIQRLYNTPISLSKPGTLNAMEYIEEDNSSFNKNGCVKNNKITNCNLIGINDINNWDQTAAAPQAQQMQIFNNRLQATDFIEW